MGGSGSTRGLWAGGVVAAVVLVLLPAALLGLAVLGAQDGAVAGGGCGGDGGPGGGAQQVGTERFSGEQMAIAQTLTTVAMQRRLPKRAAVLAVATGMVESGLRNLDYGDRDSLGVFQQRPSQGWGSPEQVTNPRYAAHQFYNHLLDVPGWAQMPPGQAEQAVQGSAFPERYAPREPAAARLVAKFWRGPDNPVPAPSTPDGDAGAAARQVSLASGGCPDQGGANTPLNRQAIKQLPPGFRLPADPQRAAAVSYALAQIGKPYAWGGTGPEFFDCSGLMTAAWARVGVGIPRTTTAQAHAGTPVASIDQAQPGDLLFIPGSLGSPANPRHVGMYAGHGVIINAYDADTDIVAAPLRAWAGEIVAIRRVGGNDDDGGSQ